MVLIYHILFRPSEVRHPIIAHVLADLGWGRELNEGAKLIYLDERPQLFHASISKRGGIKWKRIVEKY